MARFTQGGGSGDGSALNYQQTISEPVTITDSGQSITGVEIMLTGKPVQISVSGEAANDTAGSWIKVQLFRDSTAIGNAIQIESSAVSENVPYALNFIDTPSAGGYGYTLQVIGKSQGTWLFGEAGGPVFNAVELTGFKGDDGAQGEPGADGNASLVIPTAIKDEYDADFITFTKTFSGAARIETPQDDLSLRSARDITLFAGSDGPGNVYIGWGDADYTPDATNRVATIADINNNPKTWTANNDVQYGIYQAHGGTEVTTSAQESATYTVVGYGNQNNSTSFPLIIQDTILNDDLTAIVNGSLHLRTMTISVGGVERPITPNYSAGANGEDWIWYFTSLSPITISDTTTYTLNYNYGSPPVLWWDAVDLGFDMADDDFRGAKIEYHAYVPDGGTMIGTIYIASDSGDENVTHIETGSGGNDLGTATWWYRKNGWQEEERRLYLYRTDGESNTHKIHWTAQVYYASEYRD